MTSGESNLVQDGRGNLETWDLMAPALHIGQIDRRVIASRSLMARTSAPPWYLCEVFPVEVVGSESIFDLAKTIASGNQNPRNAVP